MLALFTAVPWRSVALLLLTIVVLVLIGALSIGLGADDVGSWRWSVGRPG